MNSRGVWLRLALVAGAFVILANRGHEYSIDEISGAALSATLEALPSSHSMDRLTKLDHLMTAETLSRLKRTRQGVVSEVHELVQNYSPYSFWHLPEWDHAVRTSSARLTDEDLVGKWRCREMHVNANGSFAQPFDDCVIEIRNGCLDLDQTSGLVPMAGCLHRLDDENFVFLQTRKIDPDNEPVEGFLSGSSRNHLRLISVRKHSMDVHEFVRI